MQGILFSPDPKEIVKENRTEKQSGTVTCVFVNKCPLHNSVLLVIDKILSNSLLNPTFFSRRLEKGRV